MRASAHSITAVYSGDTGFLGSTSATLAQTVSTSNDSFAGRIILSGASVTTTGSNATATKEAGEPSHAGNAGGKSVWYSWTASSSGTVTIDTAGSNFDTLLAVYTGNSVSALTAVSGGSNDDSLAGGTTTSKVTFNVTAGTVYQIAVDGYGGVAGNITLHMAAFRRRLPQRPSMSPPPMAHSATRSTSAGPPPPAQPPGSLAHPPPTAALGHQNQRHRRDQHHLQRHHRQLRHDLLLFRQGEKRRRNQRFSAWTPAIVS